MATHKRFWSGFIVGMPLLLEAFLYLLVAKVAVRLLPFTWLRRLIAPPSEPDEEASMRTVGPVCRSVATAANRPVPWAVCLPQAVAGHWMLRRRRIASAVCFGVARNHETKLGAHAWLRLADRVVLGQKAMAGFTPIAEFPEDVPLTRSVY